MDPEAAASIDISRVCTVVIVVEAAINLLRIPPGPRSRPSTLLSYITKQISK